MNMELADIKGVGPKKLLELEDLGISTVEDLLTYYPYRYDLFEPVELTSDIDDVISYLQDLNNLDGATNLFTLTVTPIGSEPSA